MTKHGLPELCCMAQLQFSDERRRAMFRPYRWPSLSSSSPLNDDGRSQFEVTICCGWSYASRRKIVLDLFRRQRRAGLIDGLATARSRYGVLSSSISQREFLISLVSSSSRHLTLVRKVFIKDDPHGYCRY